MVHPGNFQNKSVNPPFNWVSDIFSSCPNWWGKKRLFWKGARTGTTLWLPSRALGWYKRWESLSFCEIWNNPTTPLFLWDHLTNKHCRTWSSMINFQIDSRTCQKKIILLSARQRFNNSYLKLSKKNALRNMMLPHWPCST